LDWVGPGDDDSIGSLYVEAVAAFGLRGRDLALVAQKPGARFF
jgi:hypothetical protein